MDGLGDFIKKISDGAKSFADLLDKGVLKDDLGKVGTIGGLIKLGLDLYEQRKDQLQTDEERAFYSFYKIAFESAKESIPAENRDTIPITDLKGKNTKQELFQTFTKIKKEEWNGYLPDHPTIIQFRTLICDILRAQYNILIRDFIFKFNITLEEKADNDPDIKPFKRWSTLAERTKNLIRHLEYSRLLIYKTDPIDQKSLEEYYVENNALLTDLETWEKEDDYFRIEKDYVGHESKASDLIISYLNKEDSIIIGAPFGIGKTSLAIYLTSIIAKKYLEDPNNEYNYIPIFVPLKGKLKNIDEKQSSLEAKLRSIAGEGEAKKRKILVICDGLDEYGKDEAELKNFLEEKREKEFPNMKIIITTRLEAGLPQKLGISSYIRLLPFNEQQVTKFFEKYGLPDITSDILESYNLTKQEIFKPLFCWMFVVMRNSESFDITSVFKDFDSRVKRSMSRALIYHGFVYSIIRGKHRDKASEYYWTRYHFSEEKRILRKIAALRQMHDPLTKSMVIEGLKYYDISYDEADVLDPILTSYFYLQSITATDMYVDFIHKSFREYFLAEYYLESILNNKLQYLNVGIPSPETISFLDGLLELLLENKSENPKEYANILAKSLLSQTIQRDNRFLSNITQTLWKNAQKCYEEEQILFQTEHFESNKIWHIADFPISKYAELWIHRWLSLYVLNKLAPDTPIDKKLLADFIVKTSHIVPQLEMRLNKVDLSNQDLLHTLLRGANLSGANLSGANLSGANLSGANLSGANVSGSKLSGADLFYADLSGANLSGADLSDADLSNADLSNADLSRARLFDTNLSQANLAAAKLLNVVLSKVDLSFADLSHDDLSGADLSDADLSGINLSGADLSNANLSHDNVSGADLSDADLFRANLSGANLSGANLSRANLSGTDLSRANLSRANLSRANLSGAFLFYADLSNADLSNADLSNAGLSNVKTDNSTNFENANLTSAYPSSIVADIITRSNAKSSLDTTIDS
jgi:uncharacterized protein YjbI with pentapeptide repeats